jgi:hypothetical protein
MFKPQFKVVLHISLIWNIFKLCNIHNVKLNSINPPRCTC